jgi:hypothetical protein
MDSDNQVISKWTELKAIMEQLELDVVKNAKGVAAAGVRTRKGLRELKLKAAELVKTTVELDKAKRAARPPREGKPVRLPPRAAKSA